MDIIAKYTLHAFPADYSDIIKVECETAKKISLVCEFFENMRFKYMFFCNGNLIFTDNDDIDKVDMILADYITDEFNDLRKVNDKYGEALEIDKTCITKTV